MFEKLINLFDRWTILYIIVNFNKASLSSFTDVSEYKQFCFNLKPVMSRDTTFILVSFVVTCLGHFILFQWQKF